ncbi:hypothetical protein [Streptomyces sp. NPDC003327]
MGNESDRLVADYLSRVGDVAQQRRLPADERARLVSGLRGEIDRRRATDAGAAETTETAVRGILGALGTPDEVVDRAGESPETPREPEPQPEPKVVAEPVAPPLAPVPGPRKGPEEPDWWDDAAGTPPGFVGGVEAPELFVPPAPEEDDPDPEPAGKAGRARRLARFLLRRRPAPAALVETEGAGAPARRVAPFVLLAALLLLGGAAFGSLLALAGGWVLAYGSRRLTPGEIRTAVFVLPGLSAAGGAVWLWGRVEGRWGEAVAEGGEAMSAAIATTWPWSLRCAAISSALFLLTRTRRA